MVLAASQRKTYAVLRSKSKNRLARNQDKSIRMGQHIYVWNVFSSGNTPRIHACLVQHKYHQQVPRSPRITDTANAII